MKVGDAMTTEVVTVTEDTTVGEAARLMFERDISALPVMDQSGRLTGIISEGDLIRELLPRYTELFQEERYRIDAEYTEQRAATVRRRPVAEIMTRGVHTITQEAPLLKAAALLQLKRIKRLVVVRGDSIVGLISRRDICKALLGQPE
jgi:CBS domain-containing protein